MAYMSQEKKKELAPAIKAVLKKYKMKASISVNNHSTLCVNIKSGVIAFPNLLHGDGYTQVNTYWIDEHYAKTPVARNFLNELLTAMKGTGWYNNSDIRTDYFDVAYYNNINIGKWNKPYVLEQGKWDKPYELEQV